jgi:predicted transcriptional regulator
MPTSTEAKADTRDLVTALKLENRKLHRELAQITAENLSHKNEIAALKKELEGNGVPELSVALRRARERAYGTP